VNREILLHVSNQSACQFLIAIKLGWQSWTIHGTFDVCVGEAFMMHAELTIGLPHSLCVFSKYCLEISFPALN